MEQTWGLTAGTARCILGAFSPGANDGGGTVDGLGRSGAAGRDERAAPGWVRPAQPVVALPGIVQMAANAVWLNGERERRRIQRFAQLAGELQTYLDLNAGALVDYGRRQRAGLPIATSCAESVVNSLVNVRMNKRRQMRWSPRGAHRVLQVRAAVLDGRFGHPAIQLAA